MNTDLWPSSGRGDSSGVSCHHCYWWQCCSPPCGPAADNESGQLTSHMRTCASTPNLPPERRVKEKVQLATLHGYSLTEGCFLGHALDTNTHYHGNLVWWHKDKPTTTSSAVLDS